MDLENHLFSTFLHLVVSTYDKEMGYNFKASIYYYYDYDTIGSHLIKFGDDLHVAAEVVMVVVGGNALPLLILVIHSKSPSFVVQLCISILMF